MGHGDEFAWTPGERRRVDEGKERKTFSITLSYNGAHFSGWQRQKAATRLPTVAGVVHEGLRSILKSERVALSVAGRTDAGVGENIRLWSGCRGLLVVEKEGGWRVEWKVQFTRPVVCGWDYRCMR